MPQFPPPTMQNPFQFARQPANQAQIIQQPTQTAQIVSQSKAQHPPRPLDTGINQLLLAEKALSGELHVALSRAKQQILQKNETIEQQLKEIKAKDREIQMLNIQKKSKSLQLGKQDENEAGDLCLEAICTVGEMIREAKEIEE